MLSLSQFITESEKFHEYDLTEKIHREYGSEGGDWGLVHHNKGVISGLDHPTATNHDDLSHAHKVPITTPRYLITHEKKDNATHLTIAADNTKDHVHTLLKHFGNLPHAEKTHAYLDPTGHGKNAPEFHGSSQQVYNQLKSHHEKL